MSPDQPFIWKRSSGEPVSWKGQGLRGFPGWVKHCCQVDGVSDMAPVYQLCVGKV